MDNLKSILKDDSIGWLLEENNPSIKYYTLRDILEKNILIKLKTKTEFQLTESNKL